VGWRWVVHLYTTYNNVLYTAIMYYIPYYLFITTVYYLRFVIDFIHVHVYS